MQEFKEWVERKFPGWKENFGILDLQRTWVASGAHQLEKKQDQLNLIRAKLRELKEGGQLTLQGYLEITDIIGLKDPREGL